MEKLLLLIGLILLLVAGLTNLYFSIQILRRVSAAEVKISFFEIRWQVHKNLRQYCQLTRAENGRVGSALYGYWLTLSLLLFAVMILFAVAFS